MKTKVTKQAVDMRPTLESLRADYHAALAAIPDDGKRIRRIVSGWLLKSKTGGGWVRLPAGWQDHWTARQCRVVMRVATERAVLCKVRGKHNAAGMWLDTAAHIASHLKAYEKHRDHELRGMVFASRDEIG